MAAQGGPRGLQEPVEVGPMKRTFAALVSLVLTAVVVATLAAAPVSAQPPHTVDPALMRPTLNPEYAPWTCVVAGTGITCTGYQDIAYTNEPIGLQCGGQDVFVTGVQRSKFVRWHDLDGRALKTSIQTNFPSDRLTLSATGAG